MATYFVNSLLSAPPAVREWMCILRSMSFYTLWNRSAWTCTTLEGNNKFPLAYCHPLETHHIAVYYKYMCMYWIIK